MSSHRQRRRLQLGLAAVAMDPGELNEVHTHWCAGVTVVDIEPATTAASSYVGSAPTSSLSAT